MFKTAEPTLERDLTQYEAVWAYWRQVSGQFLVPPLEHRHEAIGIAFADAAEIKQTVVLNGREFYNLYVIGILGKCITNTVLEINKVYPRAPPE